MNIKRRAAATIIAAVWLASIAPSHAQAPKPDGAPASFTVISPVFGQLVSFSMPSNFVAAFEDTKGGSYTREAVPKGQTVQKWTEMITVTGAKGLASAPNAAADRFAASIAAGFKRACPQSYADKPMLAPGAGGYEIFAVVIGCGRVGDGAEARSETALVIAIKGAADIYSVQWAERGAPSDKPDVGSARWGQRLKQLDPIRLCAIVPGEKAPYPSCVGKP